MYHDETGEAIMVHGPDSNILPKIKENLLDAYKNFYLGADKLMIVAHPDDEIVFGGFDLLSEDNWEVLCLTNQSNEARREEFIKVMEKVGVKEAFIYDLPDDMHKDLPQEELTNIIKSHITKKSWKKIVTHNIEGEYGHPHHNQISKTVMDITHGKKMWQFKKLDRIPEDILQKKLEILKTYEYAKDFFEQIRTHNGRWFIEEDMTTNYIEYGRSIMYPEGHFGNYIPCFAK